MRHNEILDTLQNLTGEKPKQKEIAEALGMPINTIGNRAVRNSNYSVEEIEKISQYFKCNILSKKTEELSNIWLEKAKDSLVNTYMENKAYIKTINLEPLTASCGGGVVVSSNLIYDYDDKSKYSIVKVVGNSMETTLSDGSICIVKNYNGEQIKDNAIYFFSYGDESYIKRLAKNINEIVIMSDNKRYSDIVLKGDEIDKIKIYGEVVKNMRDF